MDIFEYIRTSFHVVKAFMTQDHLIYLGLGILGLFVLWSVLALIFSHEAKVVRTMRKMQKTIQNANINTTQYFEFTKFFQKLPIACARNWKKYERTKLGVPSDYLTQADMLDNAIGGGVKKQNRSVMKFAIFCVTIFGILFSLAILGETEPLSAQMVCEAMLVPLIMFLLYRTNYYIYTLIRQHEYAVAVEEFHSFIDFVDSKIDIAVLFCDKEQELESNSNCFGAVSFAQNQESKYLKQDNQKVEIESEEDFVDALGVVEKLLDEKDLTAEQKDEKTKKVSMLIDAMNKYRNKKSK